MEAGAASGCFAFEHEEQPMNDALVVENTPDTAWLCAGILAKWGIRAQVASTGAKAIELLTAEGRPFSFACVDLALSDMSGLEVVAEARKLRRSLPIIVVTDYAGDVDFPGAAVLKKPFTHEQFQAALDACVRAAPPPTLVD
jgi:CheY-like chemotaxis protein